MNSNNKKDEFESEDESILTKNILSRWRKRFDEESGEMFKGYIPGVDAGVTK